MGVIDSVHETNKKAGDLGDKFLSKSYEYYRLKIFQQVTISVSMIFKIMIVGGLILVALVFMSVAAAFKIGDLVNSYSLGFVLVGMFYIAISFIVFLFRKHINNAIIKSLSKPFFSQDENI